MKTCIHCGKRLRNRGYMTHFVWCEYKINNYLWTPMQNYVSPGGD